MTPAETAVKYVLQRILDEPRLAYYFDPFTQSLDLLLRAQAATEGKDLETFRDQYESRFRTERPRCRECPHCQVNS